MLPLRCQCNPWKSSAQPPVSSRYPSVQTVFKQSTWQVTYLDFTDRALSFPVRFPCDEGTASFSTGILASFLFSVLLAGSSVLSGSSSWCCVPLQPHADERARMDCCSSCEARDVLSVLFKRLVSQFWCAPRGHISQSVEMRAPLTSDHV